MTRHGFLALERLLAIAVLTPEQVAYIGSQLLTANASPDVTGAEVGVSAGGEILIAGNVGDERRRRRSLVRLARELRMSGPGWRAPRTADLAAAIKELGDGSRTGATAAIEHFANAASALLEGLDGDQPEREIAALVRAYRRVDATPAGHAPIPYRPVTTAREPAAMAVAGQTHPARRSLGRTLLAGLLAIAMVAFAAWFGLAVQRAIERPAPAAGATRPTSAPSLKPAVATPPPARPSALPLDPPALGPTAAGAVTGIDVESPDPCRPGAPCRVRVVVRLEASRRAQPVAWSFQVFDRCTGVSESAPGPSFTAAPGWPYVFGISNVQLPPVHPVAVIALTSAPGQAASPPMLLPPSGAAC